MDGQTDRFVISILRVSMLTRNKNLITNTDNHIYEIYAVSQKTGAFFHLSITLANDV